MYSASFCIVLLYPLVYLFVSSSYLYVTLYDEEYGIVMDNVSDKDFADAIKHYEQIPVEELKDRCIKCQKEIQDKHTYEKYRDKLKQYIIQVLQN